MPRLPAQSMPTGTEAPARNYYMRPTHLHPLTSLHTATPRPCATWGAWEENQRKKVRTSLFGCPPSCTSPPIGPVLVVPCPGLTYTIARTHAVLSIQTPHAVAHHAAPHTPRVQYPPSYTAPPALAPAPAPAPRRVGSVPVHPAPHPHTPAPSTRCMPYGLGLPWTRMSCACASASSPLARQLRPFPAVTFGAAPAHAPPPLPV
ncbi:hypothetical protein B0H16DRAFT_1567519, partial [Mycena metata]